MVSWRLKLRWVSIALAAAICLISYTKERDQIVFFIAGGFHSSVDQAHRVMEEKLGPVLLAAKENNPDKDIVVITTSYAGPTGALASDFKNHVLAHEETLSMTVFRNGQLVLTKILPDKDLHPVPARSLLLGKGELIKIFKNRRTSFYAMGHSHGGDLAIELTAILKELVNENKLHVNFELLDTFDPVDREQCTSRSIETDVAGRFLLGSLFSRSSRVGCAPRSAASPYLAQLFVERGSHSEWNNYYETTSYISSGPAENATRNVLLSELEPDRAEFKASHFDVFGAHAAAITSSKAWDEILSRYKRHLKLNAIYTDKPLVTHVKSPELKSHELDTPSQ